MLEVRPLEPSKLKELAAFLCRIFEMPADARSVHPDLLWWKGFEPHPFWTDRSSGRCFAAWHEGQIVAHGLAVPVRYQDAGGEISVQVIIDWAADPHVARGGGVLIYEKLAKLTEVQIGIGGSNAALKVLPRMRFVTRQQAGVYRRIQNPLLHQQTWESDWKTPLRLGRDVLRRIGQGAAASGGALRGRAVSSFPEDGSIPMPRPGPAAGIVSVRTPAFLNYVLRCPNTRLEGYVLEKTEAAPVGYCLVSRVGPEARIADLWAENGYLHEAVALAIELATSKPCGSVLIRATTRAMREAVERQGFRLESEQPLFVKDPAKRLPAGEEVLFSMLDNDAFYL